jgi:hypothetical protein
MSRTTAYAVAIAVAATVLRAQFVYFPPGEHSDEAIIASLSERAAATGRLTANWEGFPAYDWSRPTYQFSPYTLVENAAAATSKFLFGFPAEFEDHLRFGRWFSVGVGGLAVFASFLAARAWFENANTALLAESFLAIAFLHVQDCCYARVEAMLSLSVLLTFWAAAVAGRDARRRSLAALGLLIGATTAVKYNAAPIAMLALMAWRKPWTAGLQQIAWVAALAIVGFTAATPEVLWNPKPLVEGIRWEIQHYAEGHPPHHAMDASDGNLKFWSNYLARLGLGWVPTLAAVSFLVVSLGSRGRNRLLALYLLASSAILLAAKVRFERNAEVMLGPACMAAAGFFASSWKVITASSQKPVFASLVVAAVVGNFVQHGLALADFRHAQKRSSSPRYSIPESFIKSRYYGRFVGSPPEPGWQNYEVLLLSGYSDAYSRRGLEEWKERLRGWDVDLVTADWYAAGYPFSTVETYHGPGFVLRATRKR